MQWFKFWILTKTFKNCILVFSSFFTNAYWYVTCNIQQSVFLFLAKLFILTDNWCFAGTDFQICQTASEHRHAEVVCMAYCKLWTFNAPVNHQIKVQLSRHLANVVWKKKKKKDAGPFMSDIIGSFNVIHTSARWPRPRYRRIRVCSCCA